MHECSATAREGFIVASDVGGAAASVQSNGGRENPAPIQEELLQLELSETAYALEQESQSSQCSLTSADVRAEKTQSFKKEKGSSKENLDVHDSAILIQANCPGYLLCPAKNLAATEEDDEAPDTTALSYDAAASDVAVEEASGLKPKIQCISEAKQIPPCSGVMDTSVTQPVGMGCCIWPWRKKEEKSVEEQVSCTFETFEI